MYRTPINRVQYHNLLHRSAISCIVTMERTTKRQRASGSDFGPEDNIPTASTSATFQAIVDKPRAKKKKRAALTPGIIYISRVPPGMTPQKIRHLMARWGEVGKVYAQRRDGDLVPHFAAFPRLPWHQAIALARLEQMHELKAALGLILPFF